MERLGYVGSFFSQMCHVMSCNEYFFYNELIELKDSHSLLTKFKNSQIF